MPTELDQHPASASEEQKSAETSASPEPRVFLLLSLEEPVGDAVAVVRGLLALPENYSVAVTIQRSFEEGMSGLEAMRKSNSRLHLLTYPRPVGRARAVLDALRYARWQGAKFAVTIEGGEGARAERIPDLVAQCEGADLAIESRYADGFRLRNAAAHRLLQSLLVNAWFRTLLRLRWWDCTGGVRCYRLAALERFLYNVTRYPFHDAAAHAELLYYLNCGGGRIVETAGEFAGPREEFGEGILDGLLTVFWLPFLLLWRTRKLRRARSGKTRNCASVSARPAAGFKRLAWPLTHLGERIAGWVGRHRVAALVGLLLVAAVARAGLVASSPTPYGYVYDFYHQAIQYWYDRDRYPASTDCWQCYHPPVFYAAGYPLFALGRWVTGAKPPGNLYTDPALPYLGILPMLCGLIILFYAYKIIRFFKMGSFRQVMGFALVLVFPCLFISFYAPEADIVLTALMAPFLYYLLRFNARGRRPTFRLALLLGVLCGLAIAAKYSGLVALVVAGEIVALKLLFGPRRVRAVRDGLVILLLALAIGAWKYVDNYKTYKTPFFANGSAAQGFAMGEKKMYWDRYEFFNFRLGDAMRLLRSDARSPLQLTYFPVYRSVWTSLYAQGWGDMSFFSEPTRHGDWSKRYVVKGTPYWLACAVLILGLVPTLLALIGFAAVPFRRLHLPLALLIFTTVAVYIQWLASQETWAIKTKYILFLLPAYAVYAMVGLRWVRRHAPAIVYTLVVTLLLATLAFAQAYLFYFALT